MATVSLTLVGASGSAAAAKLVLYRPKIASPSRSKNCGASSRSFPDRKLRLTHIKLAGFKSFVDPTAIEVPSRLVGVVGPNGCGKSNIIDAVRWVLGETRASALRGDSMEDVIFNGSALRKPVARASVELAFDNSLGKAAGQWSQYAEIEVKRVLQRDGESSYFINNTQVRRRDVQDIFLGTGVGPRAYAIIEQGMISRVIEAKPEELRVFLEEAAGVSKYKERRRETEHRLEDTRENLARVDDIRAELETQIEKLTRQADVARQYKSLQADATHKQSLLWWLRKRDAENEAGRAQRDVERAANELEAETARLRDVERRVEEARVEHYAAGDAVNAAQGELYEVNTEVSRLEAELRFVAETRQRLETQLAHLALQIEQWERQRSELTEAAAMWQQRRGEAADRIAAARRQHADEEALLPERDDAYRAAQAALDEARDGAARAEQALQVEQAHLAHADRVLEHLRAREERLKSERDQLVAPEPAPAKMSVFTPSTASTPPAGAAGLTPLASLVRYSDAAARPLVEEWLAGCHAHEGVPSLTTRLALPPATVLVNRDGHQFTRYGVSFHGPDSGDAGILARQREIEALVIELEALGRGVEEAREVHTAAERALALRRDQIAVLQEQEADRQGVRHELQLEELRINENIARVREQAAQIDAELATIGQERQSEATARLAAEGRIGQHQAEIHSVRARLDAARSGFDAAGEALNAQRDAIQEAARGVQEALFEERECLGKISEIERSINVMSEQLSQSAADRASTQGELAGLRDEGLQEQLQTGLANRVDREHKLTAARAHLEEIGAILRGADEERLGAEQKLPPLRDRIGELRLKEQAARLGVEQFAQQLAEAGADEATLAQAFEANKVRPGALQAEIQRLHQAMADLGAINMAALEELGIAAERKGFLDAQSTDLREALDTLESAIRRIDRETREMLQQTFDEANRHFGQLFPTLFGGGEARLVMTGEEILDAGIEVRAQPPGKRNSTIHLLSGGEKALTAIALIFALFQLNPAPFCLLDEVDAPLDDTNTERFCNLVKQMSEQTQFLFISHNKITMEIAAQLVGVTMPEQGVSRVVAVDIEEALRLKEAAAA